VRTALAIAHERAALGAPAASAAESELNLRADSGEFTVLWRSVSARWTAPFSGSANEE
jgi:hypothetical protein